MRRVLAGAVVLISFLGIIPLQAAVAFDPVTQDPPPREPPPSMDAVRIASGGVDMNGIVYLPGGVGPHPVAIILHGLPGDERNLDLAQALRRAGWGVVFFHYRGAWGSPGDFGFRRVIEDASAAVGWSNDPLVRERFDFGDAPRALVGHSMGGFAALSAGAQNDSVGCVASIAGANMGLLGLRMRGSEALQEAVAESLGAYARGPLAGTSGALMVAELTRDADVFDVQRGVPALAGRRTLLVAGLRDTVVPMADHHAPLLAALRERDADVREVILDDDHAFSASRVALAHALVDWLGDGCG